MIPKIVTLDDTVDIDAAFAELWRAKRKVERSLVGAQRAIHDTLECIAALDAHITPRGGLRQGHSRYREALRALHAVRLELERDWD